MEEQAQELSSVNLMEEIARKDQQLERLRNAYLELQQQQQQFQQHQQPQQHENQNQPTSYNSSRENIMKTINHLPIFTGSGDVTINSFFCSAEYLLSTINEESLRKEAVRMIFYKTIQGQAKDVIINLPAPDNWSLIKETLKLRYRPNVEPHHIYKMIANLRVNTVSELVIEMQNIKYKADELTVYYKNDHYIDLTNVDSLLVNTVKEMTQGTLLDKIYEERNLNEILKILTRRRFEDTCIRPEYKKDRREEKYRSHIRQNYNQNRTYNNRYREERNNRQYQDRSMWNPNFYKQNNFSRNNENSNNSGRHRFQNDISNNNNYTVGQIQQGMYSRPNSNQFRRNPPGQNNVEPMEIDNIERIYNNPREAGHPNRMSGQNRLDIDRQSPVGPKNKDEINNTIFFMRQPRNVCQR